MGMFPIDNDKSAIHIGHIAGMQIPVTQDKRKFFVSCLNKRSDLVPSRCRERHSQLGQQFIR
ncbi:hypothetical protein D3C76_1753230 [compost metagenome]